MNDKWQDKLRVQMERHEEPAPEGLWEGIRELVATSTPVHINSRRRKLVIWSLSSAAVALATLVLLLFIPFNSETLPETYSYTESISTNKQSSESSSSIKIVDEKQVTDILVAENIVKTNTRQQIQDVLEQLDSQVEPNEIKRVQEEDIKNNDSEIIEEIETAEVTETKEETLVQTNDQLLALSTKNNSKNQNKWQTNLAMSNISSGSDATFTGYGTFAMKEAVEDQYDFLSRYDDRSAHTQIEHSLPITVGLTFRYGINQRWGVTSGLTYSLLQSKLRSESFNYFYDDRQTLHYMGIPLNIDYKLWQTSNFTTYFSAGGLVEKNIAGKLLSDYYIDNNLQSSTNEKISTKQLQWSINSAIGIEYRISDYIGLYAEPGVAYYFKNNSELETIYKDRPFTINLRLGLRINFNK